MKNYYCEVQIHLKEYAAAIHIYPRQLGREPVSKIFQQYAKYRNTKSLFCYQIFNSVYQHHMAAWSGHLGGGRLWNSAPGMAAS